MHARKERIQLGALTFVRYYASQEDYNHHRASRYSYQQWRIEWPLRFVYMVSGKLFSRDQVKNRLEYLLELAEWSLCGEYLPIAILFLLETEHIQIEEDRASPLSPCFLNTQSFRPREGVETESKKLQVHTFLSEACEGVDDCLSLSRFVSEDPVKLEIRRSSFKHEGLLICADQPMVASVTLTLSLENQIFAVHPSILCRQEREVFEDTISWVYRIRIPEVMIMEIEGRREWSRSSNTSL